MGSLSDGKSYEYDANGSMTTRVIGADTYILLYDGALRMVAVQNNSATIASFGYDGDGQMVSASVGGVTTSYVGGYFESQTTASGSVAVTSSVIGTLHETVPFFVSTTARGSAESTRGTCSFTV